ncbi:MAG TPA: hypothetical protein VI776_03880 [Anaerolineales bacterium]|nr:hypothetical protein [Anaerolineales bacterium]
MSRTGILQVLISKTALALILLGLTACNFPFTEKPAGETQTPPVNSLVESFPIDPLFKDFYEYLGGEAVLGAAISPAIPLGNIQSQYLESALLLYDPLATESDRFTLAPLGVYLGISEEPLPDPGQPEVRYTNGHVIYDEFVPFYEQLGGARFVGRPLTEARHNPAKLRIEQYFENLGFYRLQGDPPGKVRLIAYGAYSCDQRCRHPSVASSIPSLHGFLPGPFAKTASFLGLGFTGLTLSEPYRNREGQMEVIFQNLVMVLEPEQVGQAAASQYSIRLLLPAVFFGDRPAAPASAPSLAERLWVPLSLRVGLSSATATPGGLPVVEIETAETTFLVSFKPIVEILGILRQPPVREKADPLLVFYPTGEGKGYHVPVYFDQYLRRYGGSAVSGDPITEAFPISGGIFRQCFINLCLDFDPGAPAGRQLRPAPLGAEYEARFHLDTGTGWKADRQGPVQLKVWEDQAFVPPWEGPVIYAGLSQAGQPLGGRKLELTLTLPDNSRQAHALPQTDSQGQTSIRLPAIQAPNGTLVPYWVCLAEGTGANTCIEDHYLIWNYP